MPGLLYQPRVPLDNSRFLNKTACKCESFTCRNGEKKRVYQPKNDVPPGCIVFQLPRFKERTTDIYSHSVYRKEYCNKALIKQLTSIAQKKGSQRPHVPPHVENDRFVFKTTAEADFKRYTSREAAACKAKYPRIKRKEEFLYKPGEYNCNIKLQSVPKSHDDYPPKDPRPATYTRPVKDILLPDLSEISCYKMDYKAPELNAYSANRKYKKRAKFD